MLLNQRTLFKGEKISIVSFQPLRVCVLGPPASGKTTVVQQLCDFYKLHHIKIKDVIDQAMDDLVSLMSILRKNVYLGLNA